MKKRCAHVVSFFRVSNSEAIIICSAMYICIWLLPAHPLLCRVIIDVIRVPHCTTEFIAHITLIFAFVRIEKRMIQVCSVHSCYCCYYWWILCSEFHFFFLHVRHLYIYIYMVTYGFSFLGKNPNSMKFLSFVLCCVYKMIIKLHLNLLILMSICIYYRIRIPI